MNRLGRWRLAGVILLLLVQTALAAFLGFFASVHWQESNRFHRKLAIEYTPIKEATLRYQLESAAAIVDVVAAGIAVVALLAAVVTANRLSASRPIHRFAGWLTLAAAFALLLAAFIVPRVGSPHDDMFHNLGFFTSALGLFLMSGCSFAIARLVRKTLV